MSSNSEINSLRGTTRSTLEGLLEAKKVCNESFTQAINSVRTLPEVLKDVQDPNVELKAELYDVSQKITDSYFLNQDSAEAAENRNYLILRKRKLLREIKLKESVEDQKRREEAKASVVSLTTTLIEATTTASSDKNCKAFLEEQKASNVIKIGLGVLSTASPLFLAGGTVAAASLATHFLSRLMELFVNTAPTSTLKSHQMTQQTLVLGCLYRSIVDLSCRGEESVLTGSHKIQERQTLINKQIDCLPHAEIYKQWLEIQSFNNELSTLMGAIVSNDSKKNMKLFEFREASLLPVSRELFPLEEVSESPIDALNRNLRQRDMLKVVFIDNASKFNELPEKTQETLNENLISFVNDMKKQGIIRLPPPPQNASEKEERTKEDMSPLSLFEKNSNQILMEFEKKRRALGESGDSESEDKNYVQTRLHRMTNLNLTQQRIGIYQNFISGAVKMADQHPEDLDWQNLKEGLNETKDSLSLLSRWIQKSKTEEVKTSGNSPLNYWGDQLKNSFGESLDLKKPLLSISEKMVDPLFKFQSLVSGAPDPTKSSRSVTNQKPTDFEQYLSLQETNHVLESQMIGINDQFAISDTRKLFEGKDSLLRKNFIAGIIEMAKNPLNQADKDMLGELCGLAYSLPPENGFYTSKNNQANQKNNADGISEHVIKECQNLVPVRMVQYTGRNDQNCAYRNYFETEQQKDFAKFGKTPSFPVPIPRTVQKKK